MKGYSASHKAAAKLVAGSEEWVKHMPVGLYSAIERAEDMLDVNYDQEIPMQTLVSIIVCWQIANPGNDM